MEIFWLGHAAFKIKTNKGTVIYLDPYNLTGDLEPADIVISSHSHGDHFSRKDIKRVVKDSTIVLGPESINNELSKFSGKGLKLGKPYEKEDVKIELVPAYTIQKPTHPKANNWTGTIIEVEGKKVYHAGDTERIPEMKDLAGKNINVALMPCGGTYTMDFEESTDATVDINPEIVVPMHNWDKKMDEFKELMGKKNPNIKVEILEGKTLKI